MSYATCVEALRAALSNVENLRRHVSIDDRSVLSRGTQQAAIIDYRSLHQERNGFDEWRADWTFDVTILVRFKNMPQVRADLATLRDKVIAYLRLHTSLGESEDVIFDAMITDGERGRLFARSSGVAGEDVELAGARFIGEVLTVVVTEIVDVVRVD